MAVTIEELLGTAEPAPAVAPVQAVAPTPVAAVPPATQPSQKKRGGIFDLIGKGFYEVSKIHPQYQANERKREAVSEALLNIDKDPMKALSDIAKVDANLGAQLYDKYVDNKRLGEATQELAAQRRSKFEDSVHKRIGSLFSTATKSPQLWSAISNRAKAEYDKHGVTPLLEIPKDYDEAFIEAMVRGNIEPEDQMRIDTQTAYRDAMLAQREVLAEMLESGRMARTSIQEEGRDSRFSEGEANKDKRLDTTQAAIDARADKARALRRELQKGRGGGKPEFIPVNGRRVRVK